MESESPGAGLRLPPVQGRGCGSRSSSHAGSQGLLLLRLLIGREDPEVAVLFPGPQGAGPRERDSSTAHQLSSPSEGGRVVTGLTLANSQGLPCRCGARGSRGRRGRRGGRGGRGRRGRREGRGRRGGRERRKEEEAEEAEERGWWGDRPGAGQFPGGGWSGSMETPCGGEQNHILVPWEAMGKVQPSLSRRRWGLGRTGSAVPGLCGGDRGSAHLAAPPPAAVRPGTFASWNLSFLTCEMRLHGSAAG